MILFLPETQRKVVGNGSVPAKGLHRSLFDVFTKSRRAESSLAADAKDGAAGKRRNCRFPNPSKCIPMLFKKGNLTVIVIGSITYTVKMTLQMSLAAQCIEIYHLDYLQAGLLYLPSGVAALSRRTAKVIISLPRLITLLILAFALTDLAWRSGKLLDWNLKRFTTRYGRGYSRGDDISDFPIEQARFAGIYTLIAVSAVSTAAYGVVLDERIVSFPNPHMSSVTWPTLTRCSTSRFHW